MKISTNLIGCLKKKGQFDHFWKEYEALHSHDKAYANTIAGCMEIAHDLNNKEIPYCVIGGLAVAFHLRQVDHKAFLNWRGTSDIDLLAAKKAVEGVLIANGYEYKQMMRGVSGTVKGVYNYAKTVNGETLVLGLRESAVDEKNKDLTNRILNNATVVDVYGVPIRVPMIRDLVDMKTTANRRKDREDIRLLKHKYKGLNL